MDVFRRLKDKKRKGTLHVDGSSQGREQDKRSATPAKVETSAVPETVGLFDVEKSRPNQDFDIDIVTVHGLGGHFQKTWTAGNRIWLRDFLPGQLREEKINPRIMCYGYNAQTAFSKSVQSIHNVAEDLLDRLRGRRRKDQEKKRPLILIAHSLGGLIVKKAMNTAWNDPLTYGALLESIHGVVFFGVPHRGSDLAYWAAIPARLLDHALFGFGGNTAFLKALERNSPEWSAISRDFVQRAATLSKIRTFFETQRMGNILIVDEDSAQLLLPNETCTGVAASTHTSMCQFEDAKSQKYSPVWLAIAEMAESAILANVERLKNPVLALPIRSPDLKSSENHSGGTIDQGNVHWMIPRIVNPFFTGQISILEEMESKLFTLNDFQDASQKRFVITGIGGAGKSEVCLKFAHIHIERFWGIFWIDASNQSTIQRGYVEAAKLCGVEGDFIVAKRFFETVNTPWLIIFDNADDLDLDLNPYLPSGSRGTILITSRNFELNLYGTTGTITLEKLDEDDAIEMLLKSSGTPKLEWNGRRKDAEAVIEILSRHALAVSQAGAFIKSGFCTMKEYPDEFKRQRERLLKFRNKQGTSQYGDVYATFEVSAQFLGKSQSTDQSYADALELLGILSYLYFEGVPEAMFTRAWEYAQNLPVKPPDPDVLWFPTAWHTSKLPKALRGSSSENDLDVISLRQALGVLRSFAIITVHPDTRAVSMHPLAHAWARDRLSVVDQNEAWIRSSCLLALSAGDFRNYQHFWVALQTHFDSCTSVSNRYYELGPSVEISTILYLIVCVLCRLWNYRQAKLVAEHLLKRVESYNPSSSGTSRRHVRYTLAMCLRNTGKSDSAQAILETIVDQDRETRSPEDSDRLSAQRELGIIYNQNGQNQKGTKILREVYEIRKASLSTDSHLLLLTQQTLGRSLLDGGEVEEAIGHLRYVNQLGASIMPPREYIEAQHDLALALANFGKFEESLPIIREVVRRRRAESSSADPDRIAAEQVFAYTLWRMDEVAEAMGIMEEITAVAKMTLDPSSTLLERCEWLLEECTADLKKQNRTPDSLSESSKKEDEDDEEEEENEDEEEDESVRQSES